MAEMTFCLYDLEENEIRGAEIASYEWSREEKAPCDSLMLRFFYDSILPEINRVEAFIGTKKVFGGFCDTQRESVTAEGNSAFIYARSSAALLVDNEAVPTTYTNPSAHTLFLLNAGKLGFTCLLPQYSCKGDYIVKKGSSVYGAVNGFVSAFSGRNVAVNPQNALYLPEGGGLLTLEDSAVISEKRVINRGAVLSAIDFKAEGDSGYYHHRMSRCFDEKKIVRSGKVNLSSLPDWQQSASLSGRLKAAAKAYQTIELTVAGSYSPELYDSIRYESRVDENINTYRISAFTVICDGNGERTVMTLEKQIDLKEVTYVAE